MYTLCIRTCIRKREFVLLITYNCANNTHPLGERLKSESKSGTGIADAVADAEAAQKMDDADEDDE
jgi:hypothetical protein